MASTEDKIEYNQEELEEINRIIDVISRPFEDEISHIPSASSHEEMIEPEEEFEGMDIVEPSEEIPPGIEGGEEMDFETPVEDEFDEFPEEVPGIPDISEDLEEVPAGPMELEDITDLIHEVEEAEAPDLALDEFADVPEVSFDDEAFSRIKTLRPW